mmetsp:Transcript_6149/g.4887  ORF Transcript_6149/g.4887 Transcript_6149/m.4887 type:complete len:91 (-) Transcript_6149:12-284(-)
MRRELARLCATRSAPAVWLLAEELHLRVASSGCTVCMLRHLWAGLIQVLARSTCFFPPSLVPEPLQGRQLKELEPKWLRIPLRNGMTVSA